MRPRRLEERTMSICSHSGIRRYARRTFANGTVHICIQCMDCGDVVLMTRHGNRPWIRLDEVPPGEVIHDWIEPQPELARQGGLF
jgi:hypothetical protein